jgi:protein-tyrosine kinase
MSEIFEFLRKTGGEQEKSALIPESELNIPELFELKAPSIELAQEQPEVQESKPLEVEICGSDKFDLVNASLQIRDVLDPLTIVGEQFRFLRSKLGMMQKQRGTKIILVTSTVPEEGKTFTASGLTGVFAQEPGKRVVLIDADMRKPKSGYNFGLNGSASSTGLSLVLQGSIPFKDALRTSINPGFCFMPSGPLPPNPSELLSSPLLEQTIKTAAQNFDWVIVDSPPVLSLSDTMLIAPLCDVVVLVMRANSTPVKLVQNTINQLGRERICGVVINRQKYIPTSKYYYQYYHSGSKRRKDKE